MRRSGVRREGAMRVAKAGRGAAGRASSGAAAMTGAQFGLCAAGGRFELILELALEVLDLIGEVGEGLFHGLRALGALALGRVEDGLEDARGANREARDVDIRLRTRTSGRAGGEDRMPKGGERPSAGREGWQKLGRCRGAARRSVRARASRVRSPCASGHRPRAASCAWCVRRETRGNAPILGGARVLLLLRAGTPRQSLAPSAAQTCGRRAPRSGRT